MKNAKIWYWSNGEMLVQPIERKLKIIKHNPIILENSDKKLPKIKIEFSNMPLRDVYFAKYCQDSRVIDIVKLQVGRKKYQMNAEIFVCKNYEKIPTYHLFLEVHHSTPEFRLSVDFEEKDIIKKLKEDKKLIEKKRLEMIKINYRSWFIKEFDRVFEEMVKEVNGEGLFYSNWNK